MTIDSVKELFRPVFARGCSVGPDPRIAKLREAVLAMKGGLFEVEIPVDGADDVGKLGEALHDLAKSLQTRFEEIQKLHSITKEINAGIILDEILNHVFESFRSIIPYNRIGCSLLEENGTIVRARWARSDVPAMEITKGYTAPLHGSSLQHIIETSQPRIINNLVDYLRDHPNSDSTWRIVKEGMRSSLTCPLISLGKPVGFLFFSSMKANTYRKVHTDIFLQIASQLSITVEKGSQGISPVSA